MGSKTDNLSETAKKYMNKSKQQTETKSAVVESDNKTLSATAQKYMNKKGKTSNTAVNTTNKAASNYVNPNILKLANSTSSSTLDNGENTGKRVYTANTTTMPEAIAYKKAADEYNTQKAIEQAKAESQANTAAGVARNVLGGTVGAFTSAAGMAANALGGNQINTNASYNRLNMQANAAQQALQDKAAATIGAKEGTALRTASDLAVGSGLSALQTIARMPLGAVGAAQAGLSAGTNAILDAKENGATDKQAFAQGIAQGIAEGLFEKMSLSNLKPLTTDGVVANNFKEALKIAGKQMLTEGSEEMFTDWANDITDRVIMGDKSKYSTLQKQYEANGMDETSAGRQAFVDLLGESILSFAGGALSGAVLGSAGQVVGQSEAKIGQYNKLVGEYQNGNTTAYEDAVKSGNQDYSRLTAQDAQKAATEAITSKPLASPAVNTVTETNAVKNAAAQNATEQAQTVQQNVNLTGVNQVQQTGDTVNNATNVQTEETGLKSQRRSELANKILHQEAFKEEDYSDFDDTDYEEVNRLLGEAEGNKGANAVSDNNAQNTVNQQEINQVNVSTQEQAKGLYKPSETIKELQGDASLRSVQKAVNAISKRTGNKGSVSYDSSVRNENLDTKTKITMTLINGICNSLGANVRWRTSSVNEAGKYIGRNGAYSRSTNTFEFDTNGGAKDITQNRNLLTVASHEITHWMETNATDAYNEIRDAALAINNSDGKLEERINEELNRLNKRDNSTSHTRDDAVAEIVARSCEDMLSDTETAKRYLESVSAESRKTFIGKVNDFINKVKAYYDDILNSLTSEKEEARRVRAAVELHKAEFDKMVKAWNRAVSETSGLYQDESLEVHTDTEEKFNGFENGVSNDGSIIGSNTVEMSERTWEQGGRAALEKYLKNHLSKEEAKNVMLQMDVMKTMMEDIRAEHPELTEYAAWADVVNKNGKLSVKVKNGEYAMNIDFSTVCKKRQALNAILNSMVKNGSINVKTLTETDVHKLNEIIKSNGFEIACALCFVDSKRYRVGSWANSFCEGIHDKKESQNRIGFNEMVRSLVPEGSKLKVDEFNFTGRDIKGNPAKNLIKDAKDSELDWSFINNILKTYGSKSATYRLAKNIKAHKNLRSVLNPAEIISSNGLDMIRLENPELYGLVNAHQGTAKPKLSHGALAFTNDIIKASNFTKDKAWMVGGVRVQSFSDFMANMVFDYVQMIGEMQAKQLPAHAYTKEAVFVKMFGLTGMKINMSLVPKATTYTVEEIANMSDAEKDEIKKTAGLDKDGNYIWEDETFPYDVAMEIIKDDDYSKNCGTIAVGVSDAHIEKLLDDDSIHMVIPYHKSSLNHIVATLRNIGLYNDYTSQQNTRYENEKGEIKKLTKEMKDFDFYGSLKYTNDPKETAREYVAWCKNDYSNVKSKQAKHEGTEYIPKFDKWADHENYYKVLADYRLYDNNGEYAKQGAVQNIYPDNMKELIVDGYEYEYINDKGESVTYKNGGLKAAQETSENLKEKLPKMEKEFSDYRKKGFSETDKKAIKSAGKAEIAVDELLDEEGVEWQDDDREYMNAVESGDMETAQRLVDEKANQYLNGALLPNDNDEEGFKYHRGKTPTKTFKRYAVLNVTPDGFKAAYAGNKSGTPVGVWLDAQNLKSYMSDLVQFDDGTFASYIPGDTGKPSNEAFSDELREAYGLSKSRKLLLERGGKHSSDVPNFSQMNLGQDENGNKITNKIKDGALPHNKLIFEIEYGISDDGDLTEYVKEHGRMMKGKNQGLQNIQPNQYYDFKTNPNAVGNWGIGGTFKINRLVPYSEVVSKTKEYKENEIKKTESLYSRGEISKKDRDARIKNADAITVQKWVGGYHPEDFNLSVKAVDDLYRKGGKSKLTDAVTYDDNGNVIPLSERFNENKSDIRYDDRETEELKKENLPVKARLAVSKAQTSLLNNVKNVLSAVRYEDPMYLREITNELVAECLKTGDISEKSISNLFENIVNRSRESASDITKDYQDARDTIKRYTIDIPVSIQNQIPDFGKGWIRNNGRYINMAVADGSDDYKTASKKEINKVYEDLKNMYPSLFDNVNHGVDELNRIIEVSKMGMQKDDALKLPNDDISREYQYREFESAVEDFKNSVLLAKRYAEDRSTKNTVSAEEIVKAYNGIKKARRNYEKVQAETLLTEKDKSILKMLLNGEMEVTEIDSIKGLNYGGIKKLYEAEKEYSDYSKTIVKAKKQIKNSRLETAESLLDGTETTSNDKRIGLLYDRETAERNFRDVFTKGKAKELINEYIAPIHSEEAKATRMKDSYRDRVRNLDISRKIAIGNENSESYAVQFIGEARDNKRRAETNGKQYGLTAEEWQKKIDNFWDANPNIDKGKVDTAIAEFTSIYKELREKANDVLVRNGYEPIAYREGYFPHFMAGESDSLLSRFKQAFGITNEVTALPTEINGRTETFKPGHAWFGNMLERMGYKTTVDAVQGFDNYLESISDIIHHTDNIMNLRALASQIRYRSSSKEIQGKVDTIKANNDLTFEQQQDEINRLYESNPEYSLSKFVVWLDEYTNLLANKKSKHDRKMEDRFGRDAYNIMKGFEGNIAKNMVLHNISSALTNVIPITQAWTTTDGRYLLKGMIQTLKGESQNDGFVDRSDYITNRFGSESLIKDYERNDPNPHGLAKATQAYSKALDKLPNLMEIVDRFTTESIVRGRYLQNIDNGMTEESALLEADAYTAGLQADRSKGSMPTIFSERNPISKTFTMFQLEVNNQYSWMFKDVPDELKDKALTAIALSLFKFLIGTYLFNDVYEYFIGRRPALDPLNMINDVVGDATGYQMPNVIDLATGRKGFETEKQDLYTTTENALTAAVEELPFVGGILGGGRIPISSAMPDVATLAKALTNDSYSKEKKRYVAAKELSKPLFYAAVPGGGSQLKKTYEGIKAVAAGGSYSVDANGAKMLQYPIFKDSTAETVGDYARGALFGKSSFPTARDWVESGFDTYGVKQTNIYDGLRNSGLSDRESLAFVDEMYAIEKTDEKSRDTLQREFIYNSDLTDEQKSMVYFDTLATDNELETKETLRNEKDGVYYATLMECKNDGTAAEKAETIAKSKLSDNGKEKMYLSTVSKDDRAKAESKISDAQINGVGISDYLMGKKIDAEVEGSDNKYLSVYNSKHTDKEKIGWLYESGKTETEDYNTWTGNDIDFIRHMGNLDSFKGDDRTEKCVEYIKQQPETQRKELWVMSGHSESTYDKNFNEQSMNGNKLEAKTLKQNKLEVKTLKKAGN